MMLQWLRQLFHRHTLVQPETPEPPHSAAQPEPEPAHNAVESDPIAALMPFQIRPLDSKDMAELLGVFREAIQVSAAAEYDQKQRDAWSQAQSYDSLISVLSEGDTVVAEWDDKLVGFAHRIRDYINMVFVHPEASRVGIATLLYQHLEDGARIEGITELTTHASLTAHGFFAYMGFTSEGQEQAERDGIPLTRHAMRKSLV
ncbi:MAG: GNAT family N-acetyltransferase [Alcanivorax sp.]|jgi:putative acetyltransferase|uniref:GNAT family N-acetyltransferase n=2 Tax=Alcanivorax sp. TaxID=1872427 RepID=UPI0019B8BFA6|nr:GNAT family N-acetyltransferase [Alcanivorax sp.]MBD3645782.1 GNAT family N-acetyltransferase [Alcanivorax sp.]MDF1725631.1 GNAT family N-acetyltransferase [Alcanivorax sp.]